MENNNAFNALVGTLLDGRYKIEECLGTGGMSVVFKATDTSDGSTVAIKMLRDETANDKNALEQFANESRVVSMLSHPNIVSIRDVSFRTERKYLVMEYIEGISLRTYMDKRGALDLDEFFSFSEQILAALEHAHSRGVVHRDIKPQNILVLKDGFVKVTDFGIAKVSEKKRRTETISANAIGTVYYISPEQAEGKSIDSRSDLYSYGVMMYEMLTGELPFDDERPISVLMMQIHDDPIPPRKKNKKIPRGVERLILTCMAKDPRRRYRTAKDIFRLIRMLKSNPHAAVPTPRQMKSAERSERNRRERPPSRSFFPVALGIACAVCFVGLVSVFYGLDALNFGAPGSVSIKVPDAMGFEYTEGCEETLGFNSEEYTVNIEYKKSSTVPRGTIMAQSPTAGSRRKPPCTVTLTVSSGPDLVTFGDYLMMNWRVVTTRLRAEGYGVNVIREENAAIPEGYVYSTSPAPGERVEPGCTVTVYVSDGAEKTSVTLPKLTGLHEREVKKILDADGLLVGKVTYTRSPEPAGTVIYSSYPEGSIAYSYMTAIDFVVSGGKNFGVNVCPDVLGKPSQSSKKELETYGFEVILIRVRDNAEVGTVLTQTPSAEEAVASSAREVRLTVSGGPTYTQTVSMVSVTGQSLPSARKIIDYMLGDLCDCEIVVTYVASPKPQNSVILQTPEYGEVDVSTGKLRIDLVVSGGINYKPPVVTVTVPDVSGLYLAEAEATLLAHGIKISNVRYVATALPEGRVFGQSVGGGMKLSGYEGQIMIELVVSSGAVATEPPQTEELIP